MQVDIKYVKSSEEEKATISVVEITDDLQNAIDILANDCRLLPGFKDGENVICKTDQIYYIESIDKRTYIYTKNDCFETKYRLYELDEMLNHNFFRSAKAMIINIRKIKSVKAELNGRMTAELLNGEKVIIARSYVKDLKERLGL